MYDGMDDGGSDWHKMKREAVRFWIILPEHPSLSHFPSYSLLSTQKFIVPKWLFGLLHTHHFLLWHIQDGERERDSLTRLEQIRSRDHSLQRLESSSTGFKKSVEGWDIRNHEEERRTPLILFWNGKQGLMIELSDDVTTFHDVIWWWWWCWKSRTQAMRGSMMTMSQHRFLSPQCWNGWEEDCTRRDSPYLKST